MTRCCYGDLSEEPAAAYPWTVYANTKMSVSIALFFRKTSKAARLNTATLGMLIKTKEQGDKIWIWFDDQTLHMMNISVI